MKLIVSFCKKKNRNILVESVNCCIKCILVLIVKISKDKKNKV